MEKFLYLSFCCPFVSWIFVFFFFWLMNFWIPFVLPTLKKTLNGATLLGVIMYHQLLSMWSWLHKRAELRSSPEEMQVGDPKVVHCVGVSKFIRLWSWSYVCVFVHYKLKCSLFLQLCITFLCSERKTRAVLVLLNTFSDAKLAVSVEAFTCSSQLMNNEQTLH